MVFNFYFNKDDETERNEDLEDIMKKIEAHFADWNDFYQFYMKHAKPPNKHTDKIQDFFNDLRDDFVKILKQYNNKVHHFADIQEIDTNDKDFESQVINQMKDMMKGKGNKDDDTDSNLNMHN